MNLHTPWKGYTNNQRETTQEFIQFSKNKNLEQFSFKFDETAIISITLEDYYKILFF